MTQKERMLSGKLYIGADEELRRGFKKSHELTRRFNQTTEDELDIRREILTELLKKVGNNAYIEPPFYCDYGSQITVGDNFYANCYLIVLDQCDIKIGDNVFIGPRVGIYSAGHPIDAEVRNSQLEFGKPITIGNDVWIGGNTVINPGVTIGDNVVIGSGSVVTKDIPSNCIAVGNPCKVLRPITDKDKEYWESERRKYIEETMADK